MSEASPLILFQPFNTLVWFSFFSPIILATSITSLSFIFQNFKGLVYLGFLIGICLLRGFLYMISGAQAIVNDNTVCTSIQYSKYGNASFSTFVFAFTITYLALPMFKNGDVNFWILTSIILYFFLDIFLKINKNCVSSFADLTLNMIAGVVTASIIVMIMYFGGSDKFLFFNEISKNKDICYQPSKQTFKCSMYKNGEIIREL
jgi:hypothetical protein